MHQPPGQRLWLYRSLRRSSYLVLQDQRRKYFVSSMLSCWMLTLHTSPAFSSASTPPSVATRFPALLSLVSRRWLATSVTSLSRHRWQYRSEREGASEGNESPLAVLVSDCPTVRFDWMLFLKVVHSNKDLILHSVCLPVSCLDILSHHRGTLQFKICLTNVSMTVHSTPSAANG